MKTVRELAFHLHRWIGLTGGILLCIAGITGSILVFWHEIDAWTIAQQFGQVIPAGNRLAIPIVTETVKAAYTPKGMILTSFNLPESAQQPYQVWLKDTAQHYWQVFVNPYTGQIMGDRQWETSWIGRVYELHYQLMAGDSGRLLMGIVALLTFLLSLTGIILWPGWRKLIAGFKIKWNAHPKRVNFDVHKVAGIITAIFLCFIGFTGFVWNIPQAKVEDAIYTATFTAKPAKPVSQPIPDKQPLPLADLLQRADAALPNAATTFIIFANQPEEVFLVRKRQAQEAGKLGNTRIVLDQFTGRILQFQNGLKPSRAEAVINQFEPIHFGTFGGRITQVFYVFVGLTPMILTITGSVMWWYRKKSRLRSLETIS